jgi:prevent-host-death family protein
MAVRRSEIPLGKSTRKLGKSETRQRFLPLVDSIARGGNPIEITDRGKTVAVLLNYHEYQSLLSSMNAGRKTSRSLVGSIEIIGDLEEGNEEIRKLFEQSIEESAKKL